tara:strand:+ start:325 stop:531 length:207 start_codon:yes stop_codon:yes gene_type:complete
MLLGILQRKVEEDSEEESTYAFIEREERIREKESQLLLFHLSFNSRWIQRERIFINDYHSTNCSAFFC